MAQFDLHEIAFPTLTDKQVEQLGGCTGAQISKHSAGDVLIHVGDRNFRFFVIRSGEIEILDQSGDEPTTVAIHGPGEFTGDASHLSGTPAIFSAVALSDCELYAIAGDLLKQVINQCPDLGDIILRAFMARRQMVRESGTFIGLRVIGSRFSPDTFRIRDFLAKNLVLFTWTDLEANPDVEQLLKHFGLTEADTPVVVCKDHVLRNPSNRAIADAIGIHKVLDTTVYDLAVIGAGPAGLAAAVYGASEGLNTVVLERTAPGGQAGSSMRIENYLGFPTGLTGSDLAERAVLQANKFGAVLSIPAPVTGVTFNGGYSVIALDGGENVIAKTMLVATGIEYRRLEVEGCARFEGSGVFYAATPNEVQQCRGANVAVVGGGNSAGQAAVFLAGQAKRVFIIIRASDIYKQMSTYLARRIEQTANIEILVDTSVERMGGNGSLAQIDVANARTGERRTIPVVALFSFIGAVPRTEWLPKEIETDSRGFVRTGPAVEQLSDGISRREPFLLETSRRGVFAAGDVRASSVKRVASAVGEGSMAIQFVHEYLKEM
jgi:thioredoxin reductase (NADPH)